MAAGGHAARNPIMPTTTLNPLPRIEPQPAFAGIVRANENFGSGQSRDLEDRINSRFDLLLLQSGLDVSGGVFLLLSVLCGLVCGGAAFVAQENMLTTAVGFAGGAALPLAAALGARARRQKQMMNQLPEMVDELARAARTGKSIEQCLMQVAIDTAAPLGNELRLCAAKLELGLSMRAALEELPHRTGLVTLNVFSMALTVHVNSGGDLVGVLERLSKTVRDRIMYLGRLRAITAASRATAILMVVLPPGILGFFLFRDPDYFTKLFNASWGRGMTLVAVALDILGVIWVLRILKNSQQT
jgi:tight adherence protein B